MSTETDTKLIALGERFEKLLLEGSCNKPKGEKALIALEGAEREVRILILVARFNQFERI